VMSACQVRSARSQTSNRRPDFKRIIHPRRSSVGDTTALAAS
jgi:hypothetical protein